MSERNWPNEIEYLLTTNHLTLTALADRLGVKKQQLSQIKNGLAPCPAMLKYKILDMKGYTMTRETLLDLLPDELAAVIREKDNQRIANMETDQDKKIADA